MTSTFKLERRALSSAVAHLVLVRPMTRLLLSFIVGGGVAVAALAEQDPQDIIHPVDEPGYSRSAYEAGRRLAEHDIREGRLIVEVSGGLPSPVYKELKKVLQESYNIYLKEIAGYVVDYQITGHERGYNEVSRAEIQRRFGRDVIQETRNEIIRAEEQKVIEANRTKSA
jgi:hypothetical protein